MQHHSPHLWTLAYNLRLNCNIYTELATVYLKLKDYNEFVVVIKKCLDINEKLSNTNGYNKCLVLQGDYYLAINQIEDAIKSYDKAISHNTDVLTLNKNSEIYKSYEVIYAFIDESEIGDVKIKYSQFYEKLKTILRNS